MKENTEVMITSTDITPLIERSVLRVREDKAEPSEIIEAVKNELQKPIQTTPSRPEETAKETTETDDKQA